MPAKPPVRDHLRELRKPLWENLQQLFAPQTNWQKLKQVLGEITGLAPGTWDPIHSGGSNLGEEPYGKLEERIKKTTVSAIAETLKRNTLQMLPALRDIPEEKKRELLAAHDKAKSESVAPARERETRNSPLPPPAPPQLLFRSGGKVRGVAVGPGARFSAKVEDGEVQKIEITPNGS